ncbi:ribosomal maturation YjgA family protein [Puia dinghuensis]|uniref:DUF2809 domain-containing protein n=1 Tax=Puia dinghuensis TaxID=1792502 RepID=A0A8J2U7V8_9BACT|nr:DUF2809 domain-containing protein [Puia dinghuensis]GGA84197.1 hypothetical protein GCM10011511_04180 [Puia dinghuensis]
MFRFNPGYFLLSLLILGIEFCIAEYAHDAIIRPYGGDYLCVIFLYCLIRAFWKLPVLPLALAVLLFADLVEVTQYFHLADRLGFTKPSLMRTLMGYTFTWVDIGCYTLGIGTVLGIEKIKKNYGRFHTS